MPRQQPDSRHAHAPVQEGRRTAPPTFVGIGGRKCASTWLAECLRRHPDIYMTSPKEIRYFDLNLERGFQWYLDFFKKADGAKASGEFTAGYLTDADPARIKAELGAVRIVVSLRDPASRFFSHYRHQLRRVGDRALPRRRFADLNLDTLHAAADLFPGLLLNGRYFAPLQGYMDTFGAENLHIVLKDEVDSEPLAALRGVYRFLGVDDSFVPPTLHARLRAGYVQRYEPLEALRRYAVRHIRRYAPWGIEPISRSWLMRLYHRVNRPPRDISIAPGVAEWLRDYYAEDVGRLEGLIGRDLSDWKPR